MWKHPNAVLLPLSLLLLVATPCAHPGCQAATNDVSPPVTQESFTEQLLSISLNEQKPYEAMLLRRSDGTLLANAEDLRYWRLRLPAAPDCLYQGKNYYLLD